MPNLRYKVRIHFVDTSTFEIIVPMDKSSTIADLASGALVRGKEYHSWCHNLWKEDFTPRLDTHDGYLWHVAYEDTLDVMVKEDEILVLEYKKPKPRARQERLGLENISKVVKDFLIPVERSAGVRIPRPYPSTHVIRAISLFSLSLGLY